MRGEDSQAGTLFSYVSCQARMAADHSLRLIRAIVDDALDALSKPFSAHRASLGRPLIPPEKILRAQPRTFSGIRSERQLVEQLNHNLPFRCFVGLFIDAAVCEVSTFVLRPTSRYFPSFMVSWMSNRDLFVGLAFILALTPGIARTEANDPTIGIDRPFGLGGHSCKMMDDSGRLLIYTEGIPSLGVILWMQRTDHGRRGGEPMPQELVDALPLIRPCLAGKHHSSAHPKRINSPLWDSIPE